MVTCSREVGLSIFIEIHRVSGYFTPHKLLTADDSVIHRVHLITITFVILTTMLCSSSLY